ncbi:helix-turn-helix domain-containing protein [Corynebacterium tapiri]|uniref:Hin recombinase n=1 Tax=Corynebacterium tapiri TaxID=1448266 RepID=A0A5C4U4N2_9CORY|nr:helix-turn-helix domain-containing protein [Corynebacterium tapiri]TNL99230.1 Hin recombinase [Corynebacterium tapiri]
MTAPASSITDSTYFSLGMSVEIRDEEWVVTKADKAVNGWRLEVRGVYKGRAKVLTDAQVDQAHQWAADGMPKIEVARRLGIGLTTFYKYLSGDSEVAVK